MESSELIGVGQRHCSERLSSGSRECQTPESPIADWEFEPPSESRTAERALSCLSDPATRVLDLEPELSELNNKDPSRYHSLYNPFWHMSGEGNQFVARAILPVLTGR